MVIPWGHDSTGPARPPWVTYGIVAACLLAFLATHGLGDPVMDVAESQLAEAYDFWAEHPYLEPPERLVNRFGDLGADARAEFEAAWEADGVAPVPQSVVGQEQAELDLLVGAAETTMRDHVWFRWGLVPLSPTMKGLFGHLFLHGGWLHLLGNLLFLLAAGPLIEDRWGRGVYALFFLAAGLAGAGLFVARNPGFDEPLIGASGAIAGAMGAFLVRFWRTQIRFVYWLGFFFGSFSAPAWLMLSLWFAHELASASLLDGQSASGGVAYWAHVGGFVFGMVSAGAVRLAGVEVPGSGANATTASGVTELTAPGANEATASGVTGKTASRARRAPAAAGRRTGPSGARGQTGNGELHAVARRAIAAGAPGDAISLLGPELEESPDDADLAAAFYEACVADGLPDQGAAAVSRSLVRAVESGDKEGAMALWLLLSSGPMLPSGEPDALLRLAGWLRRDARPGAALRALWAALVDADGDQAARIARSARGFDPVVALRAAERACSSGSGSEDERMALAELASEARREAEARGIVILDEAVARPEAAQVGIGSGAGREREAAGASTGYDAFPGGAHADMNGASSPDAEPSALDPDALGRDDAPLEIEHHSHAEIEPCVLPDGEPDYDALAAALSGDEGANPPAEDRQLVPAPDEPGLFMPDESDEVLPEEPDLEMPPHDGDPAGSRVGAVAAPGVGGPTTLPALDGFATEPALPDRGPTPASVGSASEETPVAPPGSAAEPTPPAPGAMAVPVTVDPAGLEEVATPEEKERVEPAPRTLRVLQGVPLKLDDQFLWLDIDEKGKTRLPLQRVGAIAVAGVRGLAPAPGKPAGSADKPVLLIDLVLDWGGPSEAPLAVVRLRSDRFDPRRLGPGPGEAPLKALRGFVAALLARTRATPLTEGASGSDQPFRVFSDTAAYERAVLGAGEA